MFLNDNLKIFSGSSNPKLASDVCHYLGIPLGGAHIERFPDGEKTVRVEDDVRGRDCFVVQSTCEPVDEHLVELLIFLDCLRRASASRITAVIPYFGYARQDRKDEGRVPITAKMTANLITTAGANRVLAIDLHAHQLQGFFDIPVDHLMGELVLSKYFRDKKISNLTVVSPDVGNMKIASRYAASLGGELAIVHKKRVSGSTVEAQEIIGDCRDGLQRRRPCQRSGSRESIRRRHPRCSRAACVGSACRGADRPSGGYRHNTAKEGGCREGQRHQSSERGGYAGRGNKENSQK